MRAKRVKDRTAWAKPNIYQSDTHHNNILSHEVESEDFAELLPPGAGLGNRVPHVQLEGVSDQGPPLGARGQPAIE